jgi:AcrR family transcriptional regulator
VSDVTPASSSPNLARVRVEALERRVLDATDRCLQRWGRAKVTVDDIAAEAGVSRATLYRMFPGGRDVLFDALRVRRLEEFFTQLRHAVDEALGLEDLLVRAVVYATNELRHDEALAATLAAEPGEALSELTVAGLPRVVRMATVFLTPLLEPYLARTDAARLVDVVSRLVISYFLAPSDHVDLADPESARSFLAAFVLPSFVNPRS